MIDVELWLGVAMILSVGGTIHVAMTVGPEAASAVGYIAAVVLVLTSVVAINAGWIE